MVAALPHPVRLRLEQTLAQWRHWNCSAPLQTAPTVIARLGDGHSNYSLLAGTQQRFVVRIDGINPVTNGLNRQSEWRSLLAAHQAGLAPRPCYFNPQLGSLVCDYLPPDEHQPMTIEDVAGLLRRIHRLPARHQRLNLAERIARYHKQLEQQGKPVAGELANCRKPALAALDRAAEQAQPEVLCHHDLLQANRIYSGGRLWAIDWEYCAMGSPWYDLAVVAAGDELDDARIVELLEAYLERPVQQLELQLVLEHGCAYRYLELLWYQAQNHPPMEPALLQQKLTRLANSLERI